MLPADSYDGANRTFMCDGVTLIDPARRKAEDRRFGVKQSSGLRSTQCLPFNVPTIGRGRFTNLLGVALGS